MGKVNQKCLMNYRHLALHFSFRLRNNKIHFRMELFFRSGIRSLQPLVVYLLTQSLLCLMAHRTRTSLLHSSLLLAFLSIVPPVYLLSFISFSMVFLVFLFFFSLLVYILGLPLSCLQLVYVEHDQATSISFESTKFPCPWCL